MDRMTGGIILCYFDKSVTPVNYSAYPMRDKGRWTTLPDTAMAVSLFTLPVSCPAESYRIIP